LCEKSPIETHHGRSWATESYFAVPLGDSLGNIVQTMSVGILTTC